MTIKITLSLQGIIDPQMASYSKRICHACDSYQGIIDGFEIGFFCHQVKAAEKDICKDTVVKKLKRFKYNTVHIATHPEKMLNKVVTGYSMLTICHFGLW